MPLDYPALLQQRLALPHEGRWNVQTNLAHFALITYAVPLERLAPHIPQDRYEIMAFNIGGQSQALLSVVPFLDVDFHFPRFVPCMRFGFAQTNHRLYVRDRRTGERLVWFFGTTLGSAIVQIPRWLWRIPWHYARYTVNCTYDPSAKRYTTFRYAITSDWCGGEIELDDTGEPMPILEGFASLPEQVVVLTHPVSGAFYRLDRKLGGYSVWHREIPLTLGRARNLYFSLYERLGILTKAEMQRPHSVLVCPSIEFWVNLPPYVVT